MDPYLTSRLDRLTAAARTGDDQTADAVVAGLIADDVTTARQVIADALRLADARDQAPASTGNLE